MVLLFLHFLSVSSLPGVTLPPPAQGSLASLCFLRQAVPSVVVVPLRPGLTAINLALGAFILSLVRSLLS